MLPLRQYTPKWEWAPSTGGGSAQNKHTCFKDDSFTNNNRKELKSKDIENLDLGGTWNKNDKPKRKQLKHIPVADAYKKSWLH